MSNIRAKKTQVVAPFRCHRVEVGEDRAQSELVIFNEQSFIPFIVLDDIASTTRKLIALL